MTEAGGLRSAKNSTSPAARARIRAADCAARRPGTAIDLQPRDGVTNRVAIRGLRMNHFGFERIANDAEAIARRVPHRQCASACFFAASSRVPPPSRAPMPAAKVEHQRTSSATRRGRGSSNVQPGQRERDRREERHFEPEQRIDAQMPNARGRRGGFIEEQQARNFQRRTRARAEIDREQDRDADGP